MMTSREARQARYERACWWLERAIDIVPLKPRSKELQPGFGARKAHISDGVAARQWFLNTDANLGVVLGGPTGLVVADWDDFHDYEAWRVCSGVPVETLVERTARGYHWFFMSTGFSSATGNGCEVKTSGICTVSPSVHPTGLLYHLVHDAPIITLTDERARTLFPFLSATPRSAASVSPRSRRENGIAVRPRDAGVVARIKAARSIVAEMQVAGIELRAGGQAAWVGLCPFHADHAPSLWVNPESGLWGCNRPGCRAAGIHDVINFRALWRGISNLAAIQQLATEFLPPLTHE
jgi:hypothetical protein